ASRQRPALRSYAGTLLQAASTLPLPLGSGVSHPRQLKERIAMLAQPRASLVRRISATALVLALLTGTAFAASQGMASAAIPLTLNSPESPLPIVGLAHDVPPRYPLDAVKKHEQGIVYLLILVGSEGHALEIRQAKEPRTKPAQSLVAAAITAAAQWRFIPAQRDGKAVAAWVKVPIEFKLGDDADKVLKPATRS
ncbi:MAG: TonB family protein, partial [Proteobacteria bacterium]|nr:TonB family protein [Pseudomonadota bacterium]